MHCHRHRHHRYHQHYHPHHHHHHSCHHHHHHVCLLDQGQDFIGQRGWVYGQFDDNDDQLIIRIDIVTMMVFENAELKHATKCHQHIFCTSDLQSFCILYLPLLAPTGALIVIVVYYTSPSAATF